VHKAQLHSGETVVVKVQDRTRKLFEIDLKILKGITRYSKTILSGVAVEIGWVSTRSVAGFWEEIDYLNEGRNADTSSQLSCP